MPRINAPTVAAHVAEQEAAVLAAAVDLFIERGYENVTLADIAARIGLARNSLYRYFPDKAHMLLRWFDQEMPRQIERTTEILSRPGTPEERILAWAVDQLEYARQPEHQLIVRIGVLLPELDSQDRARLDAAHQRMSQPLRAVLHDAGIDPDSQDLVADMIQSLVVAVERRHRRASDDATASTDLAYLRHAVRGILDSA